MPSCGCMCLAWGLYGINQINSNLHRLIDCLQFIYSVAAKIVLIVFGLNAIQRLPQIKLPEI